MLRERERNISRYHDSDKVLYDLQIDTSNTVWPQQSGAKNPTAAKPSFVFSCFDIILIIGKVLMDLSGTVLGHFLFSIEINLK